MDKKSLDKKIDIIFKNTLIESTDNYEIVRNKVRYVNHPKSVIIQEHPEDYDFVNKQVILLIRLHTHLNINDKEYFKTRMLSSLKSNPTISKTAFNTLIHINKFDSAFKAVKRNYKDYNDISSLSQISLLSEILTTEWNIFTISQIEQIYKWVGDALSAKNTLGKEARQVVRLYREHIRIWNEIFKKTNKLLTDNISSSLELGIDIEINTDVKFLKKEFKQFGFPEDLDDTLEKIDQKLYSASDKFDYKNCMDLIRSFTERFYEQIAKIIDPEENIKIDTKDSKNVSKFFKQHNFVSDDEAGMIISIRHFLSNHGSHRLKSEREDARLSKNITIEFSLYLMKKLEVFRNKK